MTRSSRRRSALSLTFALAVASVAAVLAATAGTSSAQRGRMVPASGPAAFHQAIGRPLAGAHGAVLFGCQTTAPPICYGPDQIRAAYGVQSLIDHHLDGRGTTIAVVDAYGSPTIAQDLSLFDATWGLPDPSLSVVTPTGLSAAPDQETADGWAGETSLDVEWAHVIAPGAKIVLVVARSDADQDLLDATRWVLDHNAADVVSQSFGEAEQCMDPTLLAQQHDLFRRMTQRGITIVASSGDTGAAQPTCDGSAYFKAVSTPASDPYVTAVGGTALNADGASGAYHSESTWNQSDEFGDAVGGGGGLSVVYSRPSYQSPVLKQSMRGIPDVSYNAAIDGGVVVVWDGGYQLFGGTSAGAVQWAGLVALADQMGHGRVGAINQALYQVGRAGRLGTLFLHDVADGSSNSIPDLTPYLGGPFGTPIDGYTAAGGYDLATGLGTPVGTTLVPWLAAHADRSGNDYGSRAGSIGWGGRHGHKQDD